MHKLAIYILELCNYLDEKCSELFYFIPDYYNTTAFIVIRAFIRMDLHSLEFLYPKSGPIGIPKESLIDSFITFVSNHIGDKSIPNPDQQEALLLKLGILLQYKEIISRLENHKIAQNKLVRNFLHSFEMKSSHVLARNFLRLLNHNLFNDMPKTVLPDYGSDFYRKQFIELCTNDVKLRENFLNTFFNHINNTLTDLKMHYTESKNGNLSLRDHEDHKKESRNIYIIFFDMLRVLETIISLIPNIFLEKNGIFKQRGSDLCLLVISEVIKGQLGKFLNEIPVDDRKRMENAQILLSPIAGIFLTLQNTINNELSKKNLINVEEFIIKGDGFDIKLMKNFIEIIKSESKKPISKQIANLISLINSLEGFIEKNFSPVFFNRFSKDFRKKKKKYQKNNYAQFVI